MYELVVDLDVCPVHEEDCGVDDQSAVLPRRLYSRLVAPGFFFLVCNELQGQGSDARAQCGIESAGLRSLGDRGIQHDVIGKLVVRGKSRQAVFKRLIERERLPVPCAVRGQLFPAPAIFRGNSELIGQVV